MACSCQYSPLHCGKWSSRIRCQAFIASGGLEVPCSAGFGLSRCLFGVVIGTRVGTSSEASHKRPASLPLICFTAIWVSTSNATSLNVEMWRASLHSRTRRQDTQSTNLCASPEAAAFSSSQLFFYFLRSSAVNFDFLAEAKHQWLHHRTDTMRGSR